MVFSTSFQNFPSIFSTYSIFNDSINESLQFSRWILNYKLFLRKFGVKKWEETDKVPKYCFKDFMSLKTERFSLNVTEITENKLELIKITLNKVITQQKMTKVLNKGGNQNKVLKIQKYTKALSARSKDLFTIQFNAFISFVLKLRSFRQNKTRNY